MKREEEKEIPLKIMSWMYGHYLSFLYVFPEYGKRQQQPVIHQCDKYQRRYSKGDPTQRASIVVIIVLYVAY